jgi:hypothetical protein
MAAIEAIVFATAAGFAVIAAATIVVIIGVHQEERLETLAHGRPPTVPALLARRVIGAYVHLLPEQQPQQDSPEKEPPSQRPPGPAPH